MAWLWQQALGTVFLESGINSVVLPILCSPLISGELSATAYSCEKRKSYLIFAGKDFSIETITHKKLSVKYKNSVGDGRQRYLLRSKGPVC